MTMRDRYDKLCDDIFNISEALGYLKNAREYGDVIDVMEVLDNRIRILSVMRDECRAEIERREAKEEAELTKEYWKAVL